MHAAQGRRIALVLDSSATSTASATLQHKDASGDTAPSQDAHD